MTKKKQEQPETKTIDEQTSVAGAVFDAEGSANFQPMTANVNPHQILLAGNFLVLMATRMINDTWTRTMMQQQKEQSALVNLREELSREGVKM